MRRSPSREQHRRGAALRRLENAAERLNPILLLIVIGLVILDLSVFAAIELSRLRPSHAAMSRPAIPAMLLSRIVIRAPQFSGISRSAEVSALAPART